jgi:hypothetical protein
MKGFIMLNISTNAGAISIPCNSAKSALNKLNIFKKEHRHYKVYTALYKGIDINLSLHTLYHLSSEYLRHENNVELGNICNQVIIAIHKLNHRSHC